MVSNDVKVTRIASAKRRDDEGFLQYDFLDFPATWQYYRGIGDAIFGGMHRVIISFVICQLINSLANPMFLQIRESGNADCSVENCRPIS